jgi:hypothetical protein
MAFGSQKSLKRDLNIAFAVSKLHLIKAVGYRLKGDYLSSLWYSISNGIVICNLVFCS